MRSDKPPMPAYGEVYRQSIFPILWIKGVHTEDQLTERDLRSDIENHTLSITNPMNPMRSANTLEDDDIDIRDIEAEIQVMDEEAAEVYDSELEDSLRSSDLEDVSSEVDLDEQDMDEEDEDSFDDMFGSTLALMTDETLEMERRLEKQLMEERMRQERELEMEGDEIKEQLDAWADKFEAIAASFREAATYPSGHAYLRECKGIIPKENGKDFYKTLTWHQRSVAVERARVEPSIWDPIRQGNMFK